LRRKELTLIESLDKYISCPVCLSVDIKDKYRIADYTLTKCLRCSALFVREKLTEDYLAKIYVQDPTYEGDNQRCLNYYYNKIKLEIGRRIPMKGTLLDVGCSSGYFLNLMEGWERHGIEISEKSSREARENTDNNIFTGSLSAYPLKRNYFDVISLQDVFDHFINPYESLIKCSDMLKPNGLLIIKVHDISCLYAKIAGTNFYAILPPSHTFYYNRKSLGYILDRVNFKIVDTKFIGHLLQIKTVLYRLSQSGENHLFYEMYKLFKDNLFGKIVVYKNFHDIITVFAIKNDG
jgi:2-polyprenyl-3-methyl-5-hydroxy-6-metoxy-1,4-benzoquinol methylase